MVARFSKVHIPTIEHDANVCTQSLFSMLWFEYVAYPNHSLLVSINKHFDTLFADFWKHSKLFIFQAVNIGFVVEEETCSNCMTDTP